MDISGEIVEDSFDIINNLLRQNKYHKTPLLITLNSPGGDANSLLSFLSIAREHRGTIITVNDGTAYSAAAVIYALGDVRVARSGSSTLFHSVQFQYNGHMNMEIAAKLVREIAAFNQQFYDFLVEQTGHTEAFIRKTFFVENWEGNYLTYNQLVSYGLVNYRYNEFLTILEQDGISGLIRNAPRSSIEGSSMLVDWVSGVLTYLSDLMPLSASLIRK